MRGVCSMSSSADEKERHLAGHENLTLSVHFVFSLIHVRQAGEPPVVGRAMISGTEQRRKRG
jgi:hypothetical protein